MEALNEALRRLIRDTCEQMTGATIPERAWTRIISDEAPQSTTGRAAESRPVSWSSVQESRPDLFWLSGQGMVKIEGLRALDEVVAAINADPILAAGVFVDATGQPVLEPSKRSWVRYAIATPFWNAYADQVRAIRFDEAVFEATFQRLAADLRNPRSTQVVRLSPLLNMRLTRASLELAEGVRLRRIPRDRIEAWLNGVLGGPPWVFQVLFAECAVEVTYKEPRGDPGAVAESQAQATQMTREVVGLLKLLTNRRVIVPFSDEWVDGIAFSIGRGMTIPPSQVAIEPQRVVLDDEMSERLSRLWSLLRTGSNAERVKLPFNRFEGAVDRVTEEDQLIDYWIGLESLFTPDSTQELQFRASLRIGAMLGDTPDERVRIFRAMIQSYRTRSRIVHGGGYTRAELAEASRGAKLALREALLRVLESPRPFDPTQIDDKMLRSAVIENGLPPAGP